MTAGIVVLQDKIRGRDYTTGVFFATGEVDVAGSVLNESDLFQFL